MITMVMESDFLNYCKVTQRMFIFWRLLQNLNSQLEKGLMLFLMMNKGTFIREERLLKFLGVVEPAKPTPGSRTDNKIYEMDLAAYKNRRKKIVSDLKSTLVKLGEKKLLKPFSPKKQITKRNGLVFYSISLEKLAQHELAQVASKMR
jgi:plasmid rolling circle replication initiator protein Rep